MLEHIINSEIVTHKTVRWLIELTLFDSLETGQEGICVRVPGDSYINVYDNCTYWKLHSCEYDTSYNEHTLSKLVCAKGSGAGDPLK